MAEMLVLVGDVEPGDQVAVAEAWIWFTHARVLLQRVA